MIKYLGSKRRLLDHIVAIARAVPGATTAVDLFSGTARVGHALKGAGFAVHANDYAAYAHVLATCHVQADADRWTDAATALLAELQRVPPAAGYVTRTFCEEARYFTPENGAHIDAIRDEIARRALPVELEAIALTALLEAADRVDSTTGVQMAYLKQWAPRAHKPLTLRLPALLPRATGGASTAHRLDARDAARTLTGHLAYLDPPYNQHSYLGNYHVWETLVRWDAPEAYGVARKRRDTRANASVFNSRRQHADAFAEVVHTLDAPVLIVSVSNEAWLSRDALLALLATRGDVLVVDHDVRRYVGAQIGIHNRRGERVGTVSHVRNTESLYVAGPGAVLDAVRRTKQ
ncbi:MAG: DNA adenine methylase [Gemmatimonadaceae bacterium]|nr:DNA adenine methylase [Gemmatimonadaceae bacterium]